MSLALVATLLELGDRTSRDLKFAHDYSGSIRYGEETITETNLLEIHRRHRDLVHIQAFSGHKEAQTGADWEWCIVGRKRKLRMRVQAKRVQRRRVLKVSHRVKSTGEFQRDLLIRDADNFAMKPMYCFYCTERQRKHWKRRPEGLPSDRAFETGCLLAHASDVPLETTSLASIENKCWPWHHLFALEVFVKQKVSPLPPPSPQVDRLMFLSSARPALVPVRFGVDDRESGGWNAPTVYDLNEDTDRDYDRTGVSETTAADLAEFDTGTDVDSSVARSDKGRLEASGIRLLLVMDGRGGGSTDGSAPLDPQGADTRRTAPAEGGRPRRRPD